jgi:8-amino-7-oxononanoate synthase
VFHVKQPDRFLASLADELAGLAAENRLRAPHGIQGYSRTRPQVGPVPQALVSFCSNDYLGLASHPALAAAAAEAAVRDGFGASASRLVSGDFPAHRRLEAALADFLSVSAVLLFPTGYQANLGVLTALAGPNDLIVSDALNHASLIDGCRLSRARVAVFPHGDAGAARRLLTDGAPVRRRLLVTESLFSMDGDAAPLADLAAVADETGAVLVVDEAHALGVLGPGGRGLCAEAGIVPPVLIGTLGKAFGSAGGFAAGDPLVRDILLNRARTFIFTTAAPPPVAAAAEAALSLIRGPEGDRRRDALTRHRLDLASRLAALGFLTVPPPGPIFPVVLGTEARALAAADALRSRGYYVTAIRPPTVPVGSARLRVTLSTEHTSDEIAGLANALGEITR